MERLDPELLKMIADALHETMQCPVCLATLRPPVTLCSSGHGLCPDCKPNISSCPTCREGFIPTKPIILHQLLDALPRSCQFRSLGCTDVYIPGGKHEDLCSYRTVDCKVIECEWNGQSRKLLNHLESSHIETTSALQDNVTSEIVWENFDCTQSNFKYIPIIAYDQVFWQYIQMNTEVKTLCVSFSHVSNGSSKCDYYVIVAFKNGHTEYTYTIKVPVHSHHLDDFYDEYFMAIPANMVPRFVDGNSALKYSIKIFKEDH